MPNQRVVVIGASAGGIEALTRIVRQLPADFAAPIFVVLHIPARPPSLLAHILSREGRIPAKEAEDGEPYRNGVIYVAAPDKHLLIEDGRLRTVRGPRENRHRPAVDPLFRSAALELGPGVIAVILSGTLDDGTAGMMAVKKRGGIAIVQDPADTLYPGMPESALEHVKADYVLTASAIAGELVNILAKPAPRQADPNVPHDMEREVMEAEGDEGLKDSERAGTPSVYSCPDCGGVLWQLEEGDLTRYRCRVGHAYSPESLVEAQEDHIEEALWTAVKTLEESAQLARRLAAAERQRGHDWMAVRFDEKEETARQRADLIRRFLTRGQEVPQQMAQNE